MDIYKDVIILILIAALSFGIGVAYGADKTTDWMLNLLWGAIEKEKISIDIDKEFLKQGIFQYKNQIGGCLLIENASIFNDTRD